MNPFKSRALFNNMFHMADLMTHDMERQFARAWRSIDQFERQALRDQQRFEQRLQLQEQQAQAQKQQKQQQQLKSETKEQKQEQQQQQQQQQQMQPEKKEVKLEKQEQQQQQKQKQMQPQRQQEIQFRDIFDQMEYDFDRAFRDPFGEMEMFMRHPFYRPNRHLRHRHQQQKQKPQEQQQTQQMKSEQKEVKQEQQVQAEKKEVKPEKQEQQQETQVQTQNQQQIQFRDVFDELEYEFDRAFRDPFGFSQRSVRPPVYQTEKNLYYRMVKTIDQNGNVKVETIEKEPGSEWKITTEQYKVGDKAAEGNKVEAQEKVEEKVQEKVEGQEKPKAISESA